MASEKAPKTDCVTHPHTLEASNWQAQLDRGVDSVPVVALSLYRHILDSTYYFVVFLSVYVSEKEQESIDHSTISVSLVTFYDVHADVHQGFSDLKSRQTHYISLEVTVCQLFTSLDLMIGMFRSRCN